MPNWLTLALIYITPLAMIMLVYAIKRHNKHHKSNTFLSQSIADGLTESASLHPIINELACIGCGSCVSACPEHNVLGLVHRKAVLINPTNCIGHGACKNACPENAIELVFGSIKRGVEIPEVSENYETCVNGIFIAGELGGMGLIRNAIEQGRQAMDSVEKYLKTTPKSTNCLDCLIVGAGPAGLSATLGAKQKQINVLTIDQDEVGGTIAHFPKGKLVMTQQATLPLVGKVKFGEIYKEKLMEFWLKTIDEHQLKIHNNETLLEIVSQTDNTHKVITTKKEYLTKSIVLAIGRRGSPRQLNVPGEELNKVVYRLVDPEQFVGQKILVVGGGDSAIEAACSLAEQPNTTVHLSYRKDAFGRAKAKNRERIDSLSEAGAINLIFSSQVKSIGTDNVILKQDDQEIELNNQAVIVCVGGILPTKLLTDIGVKVVTKYGTL